MHTIQELRETALLNVLVQRGNQTYEELQECLDAHGVGEGSKNVIRMNCYNLERRFKDKLDIDLFITSPQVAVHGLLLTKEAKDFCMTELLTGIYDEEGCLTSKYVQHPIVLEREMMI